MTEDRYATFDYGSLINWDERLRREWSFFDEVLRSAPARSVLDLGSGTGEHARLLASHGFDVTGVDSSPAMLERSRAAVRNARFVEADLRDLRLDGRFGAAICVGNVLPHLSGVDDLGRFASSLQRVLLPGAPVILQLLNYDRIEAKGERALPMSFLPDRTGTDATLVFIRTMELMPDGRVIFMPTVLRQRPEANPPLELVASQRVEIRGWRQKDVAAAFAGFASIDFFGSYARAPFEATESRDVIVVARA